VTSYTVTGSTTNNTFGGLYLQVQVLDNAVMAGTPATASSNAAYNVSITTTQAGSFVFGGLNNNAAAASFTASSGCTIIDQYSNTTDGNQYGCFKTTSGTGTPGPTTVGSSTTFSGTYGVVAVEILASGGTLSVDGSSPAHAAANTGSSITSASFTPPPGTLLAAILTTDGGSASTQVGTVSSTPVLTWTPQIELNSGAGTGVGCYIGVWTAVVPNPPGSGPPLGLQCVIQPAVVMPSLAGWRNAAHSR
jgi:hypothetical protein